MLPLGSQSARLLQFVLPLDSPLRRHLQFQLQLILVPDKAGDLIGSILPLGGSAGHRQRCVCPLEH